MHVRFRQVDWAFTVPFRIAYRTRTHAQTVLVELEEHGHIGRGEALGVSYHGESVETMLEQLAAVENKLRQGIKRTDLSTWLPAGGARNAVDCALWDLEAKRAGRRAWELAGFDRVHSVLTNYTLGVDTPKAMGRSAAALGGYSLLNLKLAGEGDVDRVTQVRQARPDADIIVDCNQGWNEQQLHEFTPQLAALGVKLIEQPLPKDEDAALADFTSPIPLCADESFQSTSSLPAVLGKYQYVNIKLDKTGGLTEALEAARAVRATGLKLKVGSMGGSSLSMAPGFIVGQLCDYADLDSPLLLVSDVPDGVRYERGHLLAPSAQLWG